MGKFDNDGLTDVSNVKGTQVNTSHNSKFDCVFGKFPTLRKFSLDHQLFTNFVKSVDFVGLNVAYIQSNSSFRHSRWHPTDKGNTDLDRLTITFKVSENKENYFYFRKWAWDLRVGRKPEGVGNLVEYVLDTFAVTQLDNKKRPVVRSWFNDLQPENVSGLTLSNEDSEEQEFSVTFVYHDFDTEFISVYGE